MYKVIHLFTDLNDSNYMYQVGDAFPRDGVTADEKRIEELSGKNNRQGRPLIEEVTDVSTEEKEITKSNPGKPKTTKKEG